MSREYYEKNAKEYIDSTMSCDMSFQYEFFLKYIPKAHNTKILDIGFGSGRDMLYFSSLGYEVEGLDPTLLFCNNMKEKGFNVFNIYSEDMDFVDNYDAIWACASLLHVNKENLNDVFKKCYRALKENGVMYCSFKYGDFEGIKNGRYFIYLNESSLHQILDGTKFEIKEISYTGDVRLDRASEKWINVILIKGELSYED